MESLSSPLQGSFFTRNSSRAIQPPPTRTITVLRKIRTRRSCWESPNCEGEEERVRYEGPHSVGVKVKKKKKSYANTEIKLGLWNLSHPCKNKSHTQNLCVNLRSHFFSRFTQRGLEHGHILRFHSRQHKVHKGQSNWCISAMLVHTNDLSGTLNIIK